jgi:phospholipase/carboxylesterase
MSASSFVHKFVPGDAGAPVLLLLHGTGGNEDDLLPLGKALSPASPMLSPRGKVLENGMPRFFRRIREGVFDQADLEARTHELAAWLGEAEAAYAIDRSQLVAVGFSNGANVAASLLLRHPGLLAGAILLRAMVPFEPPAPVDLAGTRVFLAAGRADPIVPPENTERLATLLESAGADVTLVWQPGGHSITPDDVELATRWLAGTFAGGVRDR